MRWSIPFRHEGSIFLCIKLNLQEFQSVLILIFFQFRQSRTYSIIHRAVSLTVCNCFSCYLEERCKNQTAEEYNTIERTAVKRKRRLVWRRKQNAPPADTPASVTGQPERNHLSYWRARYLIYRQNMERKVIGRGGKIRPNLSFFPLVLCSQYVTPPCTDLYLATPTLGDSFGCDTS